MTEEYDFTASWSIDTWRKVAKANEDAASANLLAAVRMRDALEASRTREAAIRTELERKTGTFDAVNELRKSEAETSAAIAREDKRAGFSMAQIAVRIGYNDGASVRRLLRNHPEK